MSSAASDHESAVFDLVLVTVMTLLAVVVVLGELPWTPVRIAVGLPLVLVLPGYAIISALFPDAQAGSFGSFEPRFIIGSLDRVVLGVIVSGATVPMLAYGLYLVNVELEMYSLVGALAGTTLVFVAIALLRRLRREPDVRYRVPVSKLMTGGRYFRVNPDSFIRSRPYEPRSSAQLLLNVWVLLAFIVLVSAVGFALVTPQDADGYTEFAVLTEDEAGDLVAAGYPASMDEAGESPVHLRIESHEVEPVEYTVAVAVQSVEGTNESTEVTDSTVIETLTVTVQPGEVETIEYQLDSGAVGDENRLSFFLYAGESPDDPATASAYRSVQLDFADD